MAAPSSTTSFTFAPKQKQKQSARSTTYKDAHGSQSPGQKKAEMLKAGMDEQLVDNEEEKVMCSFTHSSKIVDAWMKEATKGWDAENKKADRRASQAASQFSVSISQPEENNESARRIGSRAGLGAEATARKRKQTDLVMDETRKRILGVGGKHGSIRHRGVDDLKDAEVGAFNDDSDSDGGLSRTQILKEKKTSLSQKSMVQMYKDNKAKSRKKKKKNVGN